MAGRRTRFYKPGTENHLIGRRNTSKIQESIHTSTIYVHVDALQLILAINIIVKLYIEHLDLAHDHDHEFEYIIMRIRRIRIEI